MTAGRKIANAAAVKGTATMTTATATEEGFRHAIQSEPTEAVHCFAYADWLEDVSRGDEAFALRWMAHTGRRPYCRLHGSPYSNIGTSDWVWVRGDHEGKKTSHKFRPPMPASAYLPRWLYAIVSQDSDMARAFFGTWEQAVAALVASLATARRGIDG